MDWPTVIGFGVALGTTNWSIYQSFARTRWGWPCRSSSRPPAPAVVMSRRARDLAWVGLPALGVGLLGFERTELDLVGVGFALLAAAAWAAYILLNVRTGRRWEGNGPTVASVVATAG